MSAKKRIILELLIGFIIALILMTIAIYFGYTNAYSSKIDSSTVTILGIPIYELVKSESKYIGNTIGTNMGVFSGLCMAISVAVSESVIKLKKSNNDAIVN